MKGITERPDVRPERWYTTTETIRVLEMSKTSFLRIVKAGEISCRRQPVNLRRMFQGKEILKFWRKFLLPI